MFVQGYDGIQVSIDKKKKEAERRNKPFRFYLKDLGSSAEVSFLDEPSRKIEEHKVYDDRRKPTLFVCPNQFTGFQACPLCLQRLRADTFFFGTIINHSANRYEGKEQKVLFVANLDLATILERLSNNNGGLAGKRVTLSRGTAENSAGCGSSAEITMRNMSPVHTDWNIYRNPPYDQNFLKPFDYEKIFAPEDFATLDYWAKIGAKSNAEYREEQKRKKQGLAAPQSYGQQQSYQQSNFAPDQGYHQPNFVQQPDQGYQQPNFAAHHNQPPQDQGYQQLNFAAENAQPQTQSNFNPPPQGSNFNPPQQAPQGGVQLYPNNGNAPVSRKDHLNDIPF